MAEAVQTVIETAAESGPVWKLQLESGFEIPPGIRTFEDFRRWTWSDEFPEIGRIDWIDGWIEVDMTGENLFEHGSPKGEFGRQLLNLVRRGIRGRMFTDRSRVVSEEASLSCEPDLSFALYDTIKSGAVTFTPTVDEREDSYIEIVGPVEIVLEIVSDSSVTKDLKRLPKAYFAAGVVEFWTVDARRGACDFRIHRRGETAFERMPLSEDDFQWSDVLGRAFRLERVKQEDGNPDFLLHVRPPID